MLSEWLSGRIAAMIIAIIHPNVILWFIISRLWYPKFYGQPSLFVSKTRRRQMSPEEVGITGWIGDKGAKKFLSPRKKFKLLFLHVSCKTHGPESFWGQRSTHAINMGCGKFRSLCSSNNKLIFNAIETKNYFRMQFQQ